MPHPRTIRPLCFVAVIACLLLTAANARAQSTLATLTGTVSDASAAVVPGATVLATSLATGVQRQAVSDAEGSVSDPEPRRGPLSADGQYSGFPGQRSRSGDARAAGRARRRGAAGRGHHRARGGDEGRSLSSKPIGPRSATRGRAKTSTSWRSTSERRATRARSSSRRWLRASSRIAPARSPWRAPCRS